MKKLARNLKPGDVIVFKTFSGTADLSIATVTILPGGGIRTTGDLAYSDGALCVGEETLWQPATQVTVRRSAP